jgi:putative hydrolase of the HAD superfamily
MIVLFDLDGTLFDHDSADREAALSLRAAYAPSTAQEEFVQRWRTAQWRQYQRYLSGEIGFLAQRRERIRETVDPRLDDAEADGLFQAYFTAYRAAWRLYDDALPCLDELAGVRLGLVTNGDGAVQRAKLANFGLAARFDCVLVSGECGIAKPDRRIFHLACAELGVAPAAACFVGDDFTADVRGAQGAGLRALWLDRSAPRNGVWLNSLSALPRRLALAPA